MNAGDFKTLLKVVSDGLYSSDASYKDLCLRIVQGHLTAALAAVVKEAEDKVEPPKAGPVKVCEGYDLLPGEPVVWDEKNKVHIPIWAAKPVEPEPAPEPEDDGRRLCPSCGLYKLWDVDTHTNCDNCRRRTRTAPAGWDLFVGREDELPPEAVALSPTNLSIIKKGDYLVCDGWDSTTKRNFWRFRKIESFHQTATMDVITDTSGRRWLNPPTNRRDQRACFSAEVEGHRIRFRHIITAEAAEEYIRPE